MQDASRSCSEHLDRMERGMSSKRVRESVDKHLQQCRELAQQVETSFQDWTVYLAGEPAKKHRKKFLFEKLQKAFEDEVAALKELARRVVNYEFTDRSTSSSSGHGHANELGAMAPEQGGGGDGWGQATMQQEVAANTSRIAHEREEGIKRIHTQVCEVNQIMKDMASIVTDSGQVLDSIESQAEASSLATRDAATHLRKAGDRQRSSRDQMMCLLVAALVVFFFVIMPHLHTSTPTIVNAPPEGG